jgi:hypothetical protein
MMAYLKLNEIRSVIKSGEFNKGAQRLGFGEAFWKGGRGSFAVKHFTMLYKNLIQTPNFTVSPHKCDFYYVAYW